MELKYNQKKLKVHINRFYNNLYGTVKSKKKTLYNMDGLLIIKCIS